MQTLRCLQLESKIGGVNAVGQGLWKQMACCVCVVCIEVSILDSPKALPAFSLKDVIKCSTVADSSNHRSMSMLSLKVHQCGATVAMPVNMRRHSGPC